MLYAELIETLSKKQVTLLEKVYTNENELIHNIYRLDDKEVNVLNDVIELYRDIDFTGFIVVLNNAIETMNKNKAKYA